MSDVDLRQLLANADLALLLTEREAEILKRAARSHGMRGIANLYGFTEAQARREVERIRNKLQYALNGRDAAPLPSEPAERVTAGATPATPPAAQASRPAGGSPPANGSPLIERVIAYLREHGPSSGFAMAQALGVNTKTMAMSLGRASGRGQVHQTGVRAPGRGRSPVYDLGPASPPVNPAWKDADPGIPGGPDRLGDLDDRAGLSLAEGALGDGEQSDVDLSDPPEIKAGRPDLIDGIGDLGDEPIKPLTEADVASMAPGITPEATRAFLKAAGVSGDVVAPPRVFVGLWDVLLADGAGWTPEHTQAYVAACRALYAAYGGES